MRKIILSLMFFSLFFVGNAAAQPEIGSWDLEDGLAAVLDPDNDGAEIGDEAAGRDTYYLSEPWNEYYWRFDGLIRDSNIIGDLIDNGDGTASRTIEVFRSGGTYKIHGDHLWGQTEGTIYEVSVQSHFTGVNKYESDNNGGWVWKGSIGTSHVSGKFKNQPFHFELTDDVDFYYYGNNDIVGHNVYLGTVTNVVMYVSPIIYSPLGFLPPCDGIDVAITVKKNKCVPLKTELLDGDGLPITDADLEYPPVLELVNFTGASEPIATSDVDGLPSGEATDGNQFEFIGGRWCYNLKIKDYYTAPGTYTFKMVTGNQEEYIIEPTGTVQIVVLK